MIRKEPVKIFQAFGVGADLFVLDSDNRLWRYRLESQEWLQIPPPEIEFEEYEGKEHA